MKSNFRTQYDSHERVYAEKGSPVKTTFGPHYADDGSLEVVPIGKVNIYNEIQSHADSVDIHVILKRYENGDLTALNKIQGAFGDFTGMPKNYAEMLNFLIDRKAEFMALSPETREKFGNSFDKYMATAGEQSWFENLGAFKETAKPVENLDPEKEGVKNE